MGCLPKCMKFIFILYNFLLLFIGAGLILIGALYKRILEVQEISDVEEIVSYIYMGLGAAIVIVIFIGVFVTIVLILTVIGIVLIGLLYVDNVMKSLKEAVIKEYETNGEKIEEYFECCGMNGTTYNGVSCHDQQETNPNWETDCFDVVEKKRKGDLMVFFGVCSGITGIDALLALVLLIVTNNDGSAYA